MSDEPSCSNVLDPQLPRCAWLLACSVSRKDASPQSPASARRIPVRILSGNGVHRFRNHCSTSPEYAAALLKKLLPPINMSVAELARQENISEVTLYNWRKHAKDGGSPVPGDNKLTDEWPAEAKFAVVLETAALSEIELSEYCRRKGLYPEQVQQWRQACILGQQSARTLQQAEKAQAKADKKRIRQLEQELRRKDKALAEAAALLILQKKLDAYWSNVDEDN